MICRWQYVLLGETRFYRMRDEGIGIYEMLI